jgi:hypothetical protein
MQPKTCTKMHNDAQIARMASLGNARPIRPRPYFSAFPTGSETFPKMHNDAQTPAPPSSGKT